MITSIYKDIIYNETRPNVQLLLQTSASKELRIAFRSEQHMKEHSTPFPIVVQVIEGQIEFGVSGQKHILNAGDMIGLEASIPHDLLALKESIVRLSIHNGDNLERVNKAVDNEE